ncbi:MAG: 5-formyltetrahydrofolate cyclo-ligase [Rhodospirillales bacterium]|nr:5-formyltetrahydrofolate cyclo-ligase [Alphaproteobacteria bacterium]MCB9987405.1 5-formyltetrahydrofolate cyclo-ligase [Rhodospirillales bacterium]USO07613.1 MAG: 5-formyltetrahydrofolate cyclo-ligase [Rhodospirillales bacterium]
MDDHPSEKQRLRRGAHAKAADSGVERHRLDRELADRFLAAFPPDPSKILSFFWPMARECDTRPIAEACHDSGMRCTLPVIRQDGTHGLVFRLWQRGAPMRKSRFGTMEPLPQAERLEPNILLVPLVMVDMQGNRLGRGAGHYDATIMELRARRDIMAIGVAYDWQVSEESLPSEAHDARLDGLVTPTRVILFP